MGVSGLWTLLAPVGRPVQLENMEGKKMVIDSSIWLYQFQATMRDKDGRALVNAHILGFLRRISKLLFYGIRPVFVFDGGAPALKKSTIGERKRKKEGAALSYARTAEKILAAQMRREALNHREPQPTEQEIAAEAARKANVELLANEVYQEDIDNSSPRRRSSAQYKGKQKEQHTPPPPPKSTPKNKWHDHDPYRLPEVDISDVVAKATRASAPDPRLATEDELRQSIDEMVPEDFDTGSEAFQSLSTELQYEIIGDMRLKSRQTSHARLQNMLASAPTALDFSKAQIVNLKQRNELTQKLLATIETVGRTKYTIMPTRIASERNRQYVLVRNEGPDGGWVLGTRDEGSAAKPIDVDEDGSDGGEPTISQSNNVDSGGNSDDDDDMEEILPNPVSVADPDIREYRQSLALEAIGRRETSKHLAPLRATGNALDSRPSFPKHSISKGPKPPSRPLFLDDDETGVVQGADEDDPSLVEALHRSIEDSEQREAEELSAALAESAALYAGADEEGLQRARQLHSSRPSAYSGSTYVTLMSRMDGPAAKFAAVRNAAVGQASPHFPSPTKAPTTPHDPLGSPRSAKQSTPSPSTKRSPTASGSPGGSLRNQVKSSPSPRPGPPLARRTSGASGQFQSDVASDTPGKVRSSAQRKQDPFIDNPVSPSNTFLMTTSRSTHQPKPVQPHGNADRVVPNSSTTLSVQNNASTQHDVSGTPLHSQGVSIHQPASSGRDSSTASQYETTTSQADDIPRDDGDLEEIAVQPAAPQLNTPRPGSVLDDLPGTPHHGTSAVSPVVEVAQQHAPDREMFADDHMQTRTGEKHTHDEWDAAEEMDVAAEQAQFASFFSQVQNRSVDQLREEIEKELRALQAQKKAAMRDSEDITQQMVGQIQMMLRLFGIPYVTAPMEAEAQCATLVTLGLVEGIITDDSDVFLFGGQRVFRNMFNQSKTVECYLAADLARELGLDRDSLVRLAYLLGSDYTDGLPGVGPVLAIELLKEFPGEDGLHRFKDWWKKVQTGRDHPEESSSPFRHRFKKRFKDLHLRDDWPPAVVRDAYYHPTVDESQEQFRWGHPDLDALRHFLNSELGWSPQKVDDTLLPIIRKVGYRAKPGNVNQQSTMETYFDASIGSGTYAPRKRAPYASKRLQKVVTDFRKQQKLRASTSETEAYVSSSGSSTPDTGSSMAVEQKRRKHRAVSTQVSKAKKRSRQTSDEGLHREMNISKPARKKQKVKKRRLARSTSSSDAEGRQDETGPVPDRPLEVRLRPRPNPRYQPKDTAGMEDGGSDMEV